MTVLAPTTTAVELLRMEPCSGRARTMFDALASAAPKADVEVRVTRTYAGGSPWLLLWGPGAPDRFPIITRQVAAGGHVLALDLAYWDRDVKVRVSIDAPHPQAWVMRHPMSPDRWRRDGLSVEDAWNPDGPVLVAGIGAKATVQYGDVVRTWEAEMIAAARAAGRRVIYRPKRPGTSAPVADVMVQAPNQHVSLASVLRGCSLVITWHSNVAVDAIRMGIPVVCRDGAAAAVCPATFSADHRPLPSEWRDQFLANLAWFQWAPSEAAQMWAWLREVLA